MYLHELDYPLRTKLRLLQCEFTDNHASVVKADNARYHSLTGGVRDYPGCHLGIHVRK